MSRTPYNDNKTHQEEICEELCLNLTQFAVFFRRFWRDFFLPTAFSSIHYNKYVFLYWCPFGGWILDCLVYYQGTPPTTPYLWRKCIFGKKVQTCQATQTVFLTIYQWLIPIVLHLSVLITFKYRFTFIKTLFSDYCFTHRFYAFTSRLNSHVSLLPTVIATKYTIRHELRHERMI